VSRAKKALTRSHMRAVVNRWGTARVALREMYLGPQPDNYKDIISEHDTADAAVGAMLNRVLAERAELVTALKEAVECTASWLRSDYPPSTLERAEAPDGDLSKLRAVVAKYEVQ